MRDTLHIRQIMRAHNVNYIWTNKYKTKRTVKCWATSSNKMQLVNALIAQGYNVRTNENTHTLHCFNSVIVDATL